MKKIFLILLSTLALTAFAQQKKVAVYVTGEQSGINKVLGDQLVAAFAKSGKYIAIERTTSFLAELGKEQAYQQSGSVSDHEIARMGHQFGVDYVCVADISDVFEDKYVSARLIDVESAEVVNTSNAHSSVNSIQDMLSITDKITNELWQNVEEFEKRKQYEEQEKVLQEAFKNGYIKVGNIYATLKFHRGSLKDNPTSSCNIGGFLDWRLPTEAELFRVLRALKKYYNNKDFFKNISDEDLDGFYTVYSRTFWAWSPETNRPYITEITADKFYSSRDAGSSNVATIVFVRDAK